MKHHNSQKGVSLIITFLVMVVMLVAVLGVVTALFAQIKIVKNVGDSISAFYAADTGVDKTFRLNKLAPQTGTAPAAGFCGICTACQDNGNDCTDCTLTPLAYNGCSDPPIGTCNNCKLTYNSIFNIALQEEFDGRKFTIEATITPSQLGPVFFINSTGYYYNVKRNSYFDSSK